MRSNQQEDKGKIAYHITLTVRTLMEDTKTDKPKRRTALVAREFGRYNINIIAALNETLFANVGPITDVQAVYTFFRSGCKSEEVDVGFAVRSNLDSKLTCPPKGINDRLPCDSLSKENI